MASLEYAVESQTVPNQRFLGSTGLFFWQNVLVFGGTGGIFPVPVGSHL